MSANQIDQEVYEAAHSSAIVVDRSSLGIIKITGETRLDLINRMSTQELVNLKVGEGEATVLTSDIGRIIDRLILYAGDDFVYVLTSEDNAENIIGYLLRFVFFNDDFHMVDLSTSTAVYGVYGPEAGNKLMGLGYTSTFLPLHHWRQETVNDIEVTIHRTDAIAGDGYLIMTAIENDKALRHQLVSGGIPVAHEAAYDYLRIESGRPRLGHELTLDYNPLETGLWSDVSFNKGCYTGQEIIARLESRGQLAKRLVRLESQAELPPGTDIIADGKKAGSITSSAVGPVGPLALGYIKTAVLDSAVELTANNATIDAQVVDLSPSSN